MPITFEQLQAKLGPLNKSEWHQHPNGNGWVQNTAAVEDTAYVEGIVSGNARVYGNAQVYGDARVYGDAWVSGDARVSGDAWAFSPLQVKGTQHHVTTCTHTLIQIGCQQHPASYWLEHYKAIGRANGYTADQIAEYGLILKLVASWLEMKFGKTAPKLDSRGRFVKG